MNLGLWIVQGLLAFAFGAAGAFKLLTPKERLEPKQAWTRSASAPSVKLIGLIELVGAAGLVLPMATGILPILTPLAAAGLVVVMIGAVVVHVRLQDPVGQVVPAAVLALLSSWVAYGRYFG
jgi:DoxX-like family